MSDDVRERFEKFRDEYYNTHCMDAGQAISFEAGYQAAQADATALVDELVKAIRHLDDSVYYWSCYAPKHIKENKGQEYEEDRAVAQSALTKAQAWREACKN